MLTRRRACVIRLGNRDNITARSTVDPGGGDVDVKRDNLSQSIFRNCIPNIPSTTLDYQLVQLVFDGDQNGLNIFHCTVG